MSRIGLHMYSDKELIEIQVATLYRLEEKGRLLSINDENLGQAPRFYLGLTREGNIARFRHDLPDDLVEELTDAVAREPVHADLPERPILFDLYRELLERHAPAENRWTGPAYVIPPQVIVPSEVVRITAENSDLLKETFPDVVGRLDSRAPVIAVVEDGVAVSVCLSSCVSAKAHESGVETVQEYRGRGYAGKVVAAWAELVRNLGRIPFYSTDWDNRASQRVAEKLGAVAFGLDFHFD
jgi:RimJ/RimL family protein N-acetyltransferase